MTAVIDANGDGRADLLGRSGTNWYVGVSSGRVSDGSVLNPVGTNLWASWNASVAWSDYRVGDFDGDLKTDIVPPYERKLVGCEVKQHSLRWCLDLGSLE